MLKMLTPRDIAVILTLTVKLVMLFNDFRSIKAQDVDCDNNPCFNGGTCMEGFPDTCQCRSSIFHSQPFCIIGCQYQGYSCQNDGSCTNGKCDCPSNTAGPYCESVVDCDNNPCFNRGICVPGNPHSCQCLPDFAQPFCTMSCEENGFSCGNGGTCLNGVCVCQTNFAGPYCESAVAVYLYPLNVTLPEGDSFNSTTNIQVCRQPSYVHSAVTVHTTQGTAGTEDYETISRMEVNIVAGMACVPVTVVVTGDQLHEETEFFSLILSVSDPAHVVQGHGTSTVIIMDNDPAPTITCPNVAVSYVQMGARATVSWTTPTVDNFIGGVSLSQSHTSGSTFAVGSTTVIITATDQVGNSASCSFSVTVREAPTITCPNDAVRYVQMGAQTMVSWTAPTLNNFIGAVSLSQSHTSGSTFTAGSTTVTITATDQVDNSASCSFTVTVREVTIQCPGSTTVTAGSPLSFNNPSCMAISETGISSVSGSDCSPLSGSTIQFDREIACTCSMYSNIECTFLVVVTGAPVTIECPTDPIELPRNSRLIYMTPLCRLRDSGTTSGSFCSPPSQSTSVTSDIEVTCTCQQYQSVQCTFMVIVEELPSILDPPSKVNRSTSSITISWRPWDPAIDIGDPPVVAYIPYYRMDPSQDWIHGSVIPADLSLEFTASNLESDRNYTFSIAAVREGEGGEGPRGPPISIKTLCTVPPDLIPSSVSTTLTASGDVSVSWNPPENVDCSTGITQFTVYYDTEGDITTRQMAGTTDATSRSFIVDGSLLESGNMYYFYVTVTTDQEGALSQATEDSQLMFHVNMIVDAGSSALYLVVLVIPFLLLCIVVVIIFRRYQKKSRSDDVRDANYDNAGVTDDPEDYIALDEKSRNKGTEEYQGLSEAVRYEKTIQGTAVTSSIDKSQKRPEHRQSNYQYEDVSPDAASRKLPTFPQLNRQRQDESEYEVPEMFNEYAGVYVNTQNVVNPSPPTPIKVTDFRNFMTRGRSEVIEEIIQQFMALQQGKQHPWNAALKLQNKPKNFFKSLLPYDHSRVKLDTVGSNGSSDYINASYIKNHQGKVSFIAAQGPRDGTKDDFWKMVWQEDVEAIVMLIDKSEMIEQQQYWPSKVNMSLQYGDITVLLMESVGFKTHTVRKMNVLKGKNRTHIWISHYEIPCWRYGGVPSEPGNLISIIKQIKIHHEGNKHLLVHCSNGVGATGTFIALYDLMDVIKTKKEVSVFNVITGMRKDRIGMVLTRLQYLFIFDALLEAMLSPDSQMSCDQLKKLDPQAVKKKAKKEYQVLKHSHQIDPNMSLMAGNSPENKHKNRFQNLIPMDEHRPILSSTGILFGFNDYVNATIVKDISEKDFIMTQSPLPSIFEDFWRLVLDYDCTSIVMLNTIDDSDESLAEYWPDGHNATGSHGLISVTCKKIDESEVFTKRQFQVNHKRSQKSILVDHFSFHGWTGDKPDVSKLTEFIKYTKPKGPGPALVHCINGVGLSAVYVTVVSELERMEKEGTIDVYGTVKKLRKKCPAAIQTEEEYCLCYQLLRDHLNNPDEYAVVF